MDFNNIVDVTNKMIQSASKSVVTAFDRVANSNFDVYLTNVKETIEKLEKW